MSHTDPAGYPPQSGGPADAALDAGGLTEELRQERLRHQLAEREVAELRERVERLQGLLAEALDKWEAARSLAYGVGLGSCGRIDAIRREADLP